MQGFYIYIYTVRALYKDKPTFSKGPFCSYLSGVRVLFGYPFGEGRRALMKRMEM